MAFQDFVRAALCDLEAQDLLRKPRTVEGAQGPELQIDGRSVIGLCSNNYLGFADDPRIRHAAALTPHGFGAAASRHISGTNALHVQLELRLAAFTGLPAALLFSSGYAANVGAIQSLAARGTAIFSDRLNHASLIDGARLSRGQVFIYDHLDLEHLARLLAEYRPAFANALIVSESVFSMEGDLADLPGLRALADRFDCGLVVDEAHALGVFGPRGRGLCAGAGITPDLLIGTLGKAFGTSGAFVAGARETVRLVENRARSYIFSTAPPPSLAAAGIAATDLVEAADDRRSRLAAISNRLRSAIADLGFEVPPGAAPIIPVVIGPARATMAISAALLERGVFVHGVRPPTVPEGSSRLRVVPMATHTDAQIDAAIAAFAAVQNLR